MKTEKPIILTDIDGIAVQWQSNLPFFCAEHNIPTETIVQMIVDEKFRSATELFGCNDELAQKMMDQYNNSKWIRGLKGYDDALVHINKLKKNYDFVAITALGTDTTAILNRMANLNILFPEAFKEVMVVGRQESKCVRYLEAKKRYGCRIKCFVDDLAHNLDDCHTVMNHVPQIHMIRGEGDRVAPKCEHFTVPDWSYISDWLNGDADLSGGM